MRKGFWKGLRAIEIGIVLSFIFIILSVIGTRFSKFKCRAMQSEAKFALQEVYAAQKQFHSENDHYATLKKLKDEDGRIKIFEKYYSLSDQIEPSKDSFMIMATGISGLVAGEVWTVNEYKEIKLANAVCKN